MMLHARTPAAALVGLLTVAAAAQAQTRWTVDSKSSLAWWQMSPNLNHLWATTCPEEPSWRPGENRSGGWHIDPKLKLPGSGYGNVEDTVHVPLFPRPEAQPLCSEAVAGEVLLPDTLKWRGAHGVVRVKADALITGQAMRDVMMHQLLQTWSFSEITFTLDSLVIAAVKAFPGAGGMRVLAKWRVPAWMLLDLTPSIHSLGLGVNTWLWKDLFMGADLVFHPEATATN